MSSAPSASSLGRRIRAPSPPGSLTAAARVVFVLQQVAVGAQRAHLHGFDVHILSPQYAKMDALIHTAAAGPRSLRGTAPAAARRASRYSAAASRGWRGHPDAGRPGAASSAQATDRSLPGRPESSFPPLGLLSPPNPLRWASAGAPILQAPMGRAAMPTRFLQAPYSPPPHEPPFLGGRRGHTPGPFFPTAFFRKESGAPAASEAPGALPIKIQRSHLQKSGPPRGHPGRRMARRVVAPHIVGPSCGSFASA